MNDDHTFAPEMTAEEAIQMVLKRPEMYGLQKVAAVPDTATEIARNLANSTALTGQDALVIAESAVKVAAAGEIAEDHARCDGRLLSVEKHAERMEAERDAALTAIERVRALHPKHEVLICGAMAEVPHRHGSEREPYPIRPVTCTKLQGREGSHRDAACCWNFQEFDNVAAYKSDEWADRSICSHCQTAWPCLTIAALDGAPEPEWEEHINYGAERTDGSVAYEPRGRNYATHQQVARFGPWLPVPEEKP